MDAIETNPFVRDTPEQLEAVIEGKIKLPTARKRRKIRDREQSIQDNAITELPRIYNAADLIADQDVVIPLEIIPGLLHRGMKASISGSSKSQKTWLALYLALSLAAGTEFFGMTTQPTVVLYVNLEIPLGFFRNRMAAVADKTGLVVANLGRLYIWTLRGHVVSFDDFLPQLIAQAKELGAGLVIIDPIYKLLAGKDENSAGDIGKLCNDFDRLAEETNAAVLYVAHYSKGNQAGKSAIDRISGSGVFGRDADTIINLTQHEQPNCLTIEFTLRNHKALDPFVVEWEYPLMVRRRELNPAHLKSAISSKKIDIPLDILLSMVPSGEEDPILQDELMALIKAQGVGENRAREEIKALVDGGRIYKWALPRSGTRPAIAYHQSPPTG